VSKSAERAGGVRVFIADGSQLGCQLMAAAVRGAVIGLGLLATRLTLLEFAQDSKRTLRTLQ